MLVQSPNLSPAQRERRKHSNFLFLDICSTKKNYFLPKNSEVFQIIWSLQYLHAVFKKECYSFSVTFDTLWVFISDSVQYDLDWKVCGCIYCIYT